MQKESVTAPYLSEMFEVSRRTINRDIEDLCKAGIPIVTRQGANGGISIIDGYKIDKTMLTHDEMQDILAGLRSLDSVNGTNRYGQLMEKLSIGSSDFLVGNQSVLIDLSSWYVWGWCKSREDFRLFKLNRMDKVHLSGHVFSDRTAPLPDLRDERIFTGGIKVKALFEVDCKWRLVEEFGPHCFQEQKDGTLLFQADYTNQDNLLTWLLSFRDKVELLEPKEIREQLRQSILQMKKKYDNVADG